ncbi:hypothetical protein K469DRAFT_156544 [Zopfia rhizophila CBS 207.26]|uniref:Uncharacterized protein n=1 Tax=Zopfia rhizophila CBS 207.26 TaxID=1314779 RepID=A0A6A6E451_9PEZI|nr:hypothetical protein K469DRAFT_156544 [Zopfia rhizophila CBS 207.26]
MFRAHSVPTGPLTPAQVRRPPTVPRELLTKKHRLDVRKRLDIYRFLVFGWHEVDITKYMGVSRSEVYQIERNLKLYGSTCKPSNPGVQLGRPRKIGSKDKQALPKELHQSS